MPFKEICRMEERVGMLAEYDSGHWSVSELCRRRGVGHVLCLAGAPGERGCELVFRPVARGAIVSTPRGSR